MEYAFEHEGKGFLPSGSTPIPASDVAEHNKELEAAEIAWLKTGPDAAVLYVKHSKTFDGDTKGIPFSITTWLGTQVSESAFFGPRRHIGFGYHTYRRAVTCRIFGVLYHGWYMESSGNYCRLRKAKNQKAVR